MAGLRILGGGMVLRMVIRARWRASMRVGALLLLLGLGGMAGAWDAAAAWAAGPGRGLGTGLGAGLGGDPAVYGPSAWPDGQDAEPVIQKVPARAANTLVMLPDGSSVHVELAQSNAEREYGLMDRASLPQGRGMLFIHDRPGTYSYWMYHCKIGLDIVWMDQERKIAELSADTPPCRGKAATCPPYGGHATSIYVLELPVGSIKAHGLKVGQAVNFSVP